MTRSEREKVGYVLGKIDKAINSLMGKAVDRGAALGALLDAKDTVEDMTAGKKEV